MVDFYDSLEDEVVEECFPDSLDYSRRINNDERSTRHKSLCLKKLKNVLHVLNKQCSEPSITQEEDFSFTTEKKENVSDSESQTDGPARFPLHVFNNEILKEKGLQLNSDGSFTKSPRVESEDLPFVAREYRNFQFQKRKALQTNFRVPTANVTRKSVVGLNEKPESGASMINIIRAGRRKKSIEEQLMSASSSLKNETSQQFMMNDNMTDSMKEMLLRKQTLARFLPKTFNTSQHLRQVKRVMNLLDNSKLLKESKLTGHFEKRYSNSNEKQSLPEINSGRSSKSQIDPMQKKFQLQYNLHTRQSESSKFINTKIFKNQSEIVLKPQLSYSERRQKANGFNPMCLRLGNKKIQSESNRSNFGDSVADRLSDVSSTVPDREVLDDEDEELFYRKLMEKETRGLESSARSEIPLRKYKNYLGSTVKGQKEVNLHKGSTSLHQGVSKSTSIDMPFKLLQQAKNQKKIPHYCSKNTPALMSKNELAIKAKAYGYMANARNLFKLKMLPESKQVDPASVAISGTRDHKCLQRTGKEGLNKEKSYPGSINSNAIFKDPKTPAKKTRSLCKAEKEKPFALPRLENPYKNDIKLKSEILKEVTSCIGGLQKTLNTSTWDLGEEANARGCRL